MTILTEGQRNVEHLVSEANDKRSRDGIKLAISPDMYLSGTILKATGAQDNGVDVYERFDGTGTASAILWRHTDATAAIADAVAHTRDAEYKLPLVVFLDAATQVHKDAAVASLKTVGMIARDAT